MTCEHRNRKDLVAPQEVTIAIEGHKYMVGVLAWCHGCGAVLIRSPWSGKPHQYEWIEPDRNEKFPVFADWEMHLKHAVNLAALVGHGPTETISALVMVLSESVEPNLLIRGLVLACDQGGKLHALTVRMMTDWLATKEITNNSVLEGKSND